jgi:hypothetical protein
VLYWMVFLPLLHCSDKTDMAIRLFTALRLEDQSLRLTIQEAATSLATAYKVTLEGLLLSPKCTFVTWRWFWNAINRSFYTANYFV